MRARPALLLALLVVAGFGGSRTGDDRGSAAPAVTERSLVVDYEVDGRSGSVTTALPAPSCAEAARAGTADGTFAIPLPGGPAVLRPYDGPGAYDGAVVADATDAQVVVRADGSGAAHVLGDREVTAAWRCVD